MIGKFLSKQAVAILVFFANFCLISTAYSAPSIPTVLTAQSLIYCTTPSGFSLNPQRADAGSNMNVVTEQIYDKLFDFDPDTNQLKPALAEHFEVSEDGLTISLYLRPKVTFHTTAWFTPTRYLNAEDVIFSLHRMMGRNLELPELSADQQATLARYQINNQLTERTYFPYFESIRLNEKVLSISSPKQNIVKIQLTQPDNNLLFHLASQYAVILSKEYALQLNADENLAQLNHLPIGTGVYQLESYTENQQVRLSPNRNYWREKAKMQRVIVDFSTTATGRMAKFLNGECDISAFPEPSQLSIVKNQQRLNHTGANLAFLAFNLKKPMMQDADFRHYLSQQIDRQRIANTLFYGTATVAKTVLPTTLLPEAYQSVAEAPVIRKNLTKIDRLQLWVVDEKRIYSPHPLKMAELIRSDLAKVGIDLEIKHVSRSYLAQKLAEGKEDYDMILGGWLANNFDPHSFLSPLLSCRAQPWITNLSNWCDPTLDHYLTQIAQATKKADKLNYAQQTEQYIAQQRPLLPLVSVQRNLLVNEKLANVKVSPFGQVPLAQIEFK